MPRTPRRSPPAVASIGVVLVALVGWGCAGVTPSLAPAAAPARPSASHAPQPPRASAIATPSPSVIATPSPSAAALATVPPTQALIEFLLERTAADPTDGEVQLQLGLAVLQRIRETADPSLYPAADAALQAARRLRPDDPLALVGIGGLQLGRHDFAAALATGREALRLDPGSTAADGVVVDALIELGRYDEAFALVDMLAGGATDLPTLARVSYARELRGDLDGALAAMELAATAPGLAPENTAFALALVGHLERQTGDPRAARDAYEAALRLVPDHAPSIAGLGRLALGAGDLAEARARFEAAAAIVPLPEYVIALGETLEAAGDPAGARRQYDLARAQLVLSEAAGVVVDTELALFEADHGDAARAVDLARTGYAATPTVRAADALAWALHRAGTDAEARTMSREALRLGSMDPPLRYHAGAIAAALGDDVTARAYLEQALGTDPGFSATGAAEARRLLDALPS